MRHKEADIEVRLEQFKGSLFYVSWVVVKNHSDLSPTWIVDLSQQIPDEVFEVNVVGALWCLKESLAFDDMPDASTQCDSFKSLPV